MCILHIVQHDTIFVPPLLSHGSILYEFLIGFCVLSLLASLIFISVHASGPNNNSFYRNYYVTWGHDHVLLLNQESEVQLSLDQNSGCGSYFYRSIPFFISLHNPIQKQIPCSTSINICARLKKFYLKKMRF